MSSLQERQLCNHYANIRQRLLTPKKPPQPKPVLPPAPVIRPYKLIYLFAHQSEEVPYNHCLNVRQIAKIVAKFYDVTLMDMFSERRQAHLVKPRQVAMYLARHMTTRSLPGIGTTFGGRDHTTVLHAIRKIEAKLQNDEGLKAEVALLRAQISELMTRPQAA